VKIDRIEIRIIRLPLRERFVISSGAWTDRSVFLVSLHAGGLTSWGEVVAAEDPSYSYETTETAWHVIRDYLAPAIVGKDFASPAEMIGAAGWVRGHRMAKAGLEMAAWDLWARSHGVSLAQEVGGEREAVAVGVSIGIQPDDATLLAKVEGHLAEGYRRIKLKIKPGRDVEMLQAVRKRFPEAKLMADANSAYSMADADHLAALDELDLMMIEQPLAHDDIRDHARLQERLTTPVCLDESIRSAADARLALELGACRIINIKPGRVGGFGESRAIHDLCREAGVAVWCGGMLESGVGRAHNVALATLPGFTLPGDISESRRYWEEDIVTPEFEMDGGFMPVPRWPGMGVEPRLDRIESLQLRREVFSG
jgi:O-succinylbenzoate synthase